MTYNPNIPQATDDLSDSQGDLLTNFSTANTSFGINHYAFSDLTINNGKHNNVQTPLIVGGVHPTTIAAEPAFYGMQDSVPLGVLQYSRGPSNAVPTPVTSLQSTVAPIVLAPSATTNVLDFTGLSRAICMLYVTDTSHLDSFVYYIVWTGSIFVLQKVVSNSLSFVGQGSANILQLKNNYGATTLSNVFWTLDILRIN